ncbi:MAG: hypothetical protein L3J37_10845 [Rhodobacteraceae bacterium]|nr:hypothetical protein [Paracoccaceae bacterium]
MSYLPVFIVLSVVLAAMMVAVSAPLDYAQSAPLFSVVAFASAPVVLHKIKDKSMAVGFLIGLSLFGSVPLMRLLEIDGFIGETLITLTYTALMFTIGLGWKRSWK